jgi:hypothetical protein
VHHKVVDADENLSKYSVERLLEIKAQHEAPLAQASEADALLTAEAVAALLDTVSAATPMDFRGARSIISR